MPKTLRFQDVVAKAGRPRPVTLWSDPGSDLSFTRAIRENRVLTVVQPRTTNQKDYGIIGFQKDPQASYLMFPRSLPEDSDVRVIGIKYDLVDERPVGEVIATKPVDREKSPLKNPKPPAQKPKQQPGRPPPVPRTQKKFIIHLRRTATFEVTITVQAQDQDQAKQKALESVTRTPFGSNAPGVREKAQITLIKGKD